jgi:hypothetical protein
MHVLMIKLNSIYLAFELSLFSKRISLLGIQYHQGKEHILDGQAMNFNEIAVGAIIVYFRIAVYSDIKKGEE